MDNFDIFDFYPSNTPEYMAPAWLGCIQWAAGKPEFLAAFENETGVKDIVNAEDVGEFVRWVNDNIWGDPSTGPPPTHL